MGNGLGVPGEFVGLRVEGNVQARNVVVNHGDGQVNIAASNGDTAPVTSFKSVGTACVFFKGRTDMLSKIKGILTGAAQREKFHERILVIYGIPGIGKSELMRRFAEVYSSEYSNIGWIDAESPAKIGKSFEAIADTLRVEWNQNLQLKDNVKKVYEHVAKHCGPNCLFIFDNVTDKEKEIHEFLPADQSVTNPPLIVMTANKPIRPYKELRLEELKLQEAMDIFRASQFLNLSEEQFSQVQKPLKELATLIGYHPLGIVIAASYLCETGAEDLKESLNYYVEEVRELSDNFTEAEPEVPAGTQYSKNLKALWQLTIKRIEKGAQSNAMLSILQLVGYLDPEDVTKGELKWLCTTDCPFEDENCWTAFRENVSHIFDAALTQLIKLSILIPIPNPEMGRDNPQHYRVHRLIQRFARRQDEQHWGFSRALYSCIDHYGNLIYPGCFAHLNAIVKTGMAVDEKLKQMCAAFALKANRPRQLSGLIKYLEKDGQKSPETDYLLVLIQLYENYKRERHDPASAMEYILSVVGIAKEWIGPEYGRYMIQHCATHLFIKMLFESSEDLMLIPVPQGGFDDIHDWVKGLIDLHNEQAGQDWKFFPKIIGHCKYKNYQVLEKVTSQNERLNSMTDFVNCLVHRVYEYCRNDDELDGYWHIMAASFLINGCQRLLRSEKMEFVLNHAADTVRRCTRKKRSVMEVSDGFRDFLGVQNNKPDCISKFLSCSSFMEELSAHTKMLVLMGFSEEHIPWGVAVGRAILYDHNKVLEAVISSWDLPDLPFIFRYFDEVFLYATTRLPVHYSRFISRYSRQFQSALQLLERLESEASCDFRGSIILAVVQRALPVLRNLIESSRE